MEIDPAALSTIGYTSGTTGHPKGAMQSHRAVITNSAMTSQIQMRGSNDCVVSALPCPHVYANVIMMSMMMFGSKLVLHRAFNVDLAFADIAAHKATIFDGHKRYTSEIEGCALQCFYAPLQNTSSLTFQLKKVLSTG